MYIDTVPNRSSPPAILLREGWREGGKVKKRTLANLSKWPPEVVEGLRVLLKGGTAVKRLPEAFEIERSLPHGHVAAALGALERLGLPGLIDSRPSPQRDRVLALIAARILHPGSKLAAARGLAEETARDTLGEALGLGEAGEDDLYAAMDWLLTRQPDIERRLAKRRLKEGTLVLYDLTSVYLEGRRCPLAKRGHSRDGKRSKLQIEFGLLCDAGGCPVAVEVFQGNAADPMTVGAQINKLKDRFGLKRVVLVGDRGMLTEARIREEVKPSGLGLDRRLAFFGDPVPGGVGRGADVAVRPNGPDRGAQRRVSGRAADGVPQSAVGQGALAQARGSAASDREVARAHRQGHQAREKPS